MKNQGWKSRWMMSAMLALLLSAGRMSAAQTDETTMVVSEAGVAGEQQHIAVMADEAENRYWSEGEFEGVVADTGDQVLAVINSDNPAQWIVVFDRPAVSRALALHPTARLQKAGSSALRTTAITLRQEIITGQNQAINSWKANSLVTKVNARFDMLVNGVAVKATGKHIKEIAKQPGIAAVYPDYVLHVNLADSVPLIGAPDVWDMNDANGNPVTGSGIRVAVIDTGIDYTHTTFGSCSALNTGADCRIIDGYDFVNDDANPMDDNNHGTHVAGIIAGDDTAITGVAPDALLYAYKVCNSGGSCNTSDVIAGLERAADPDGNGDLSDHVDAANLSLGGAGGPDSPLSIAVDEAVDAGISVVVSAGNSGSSYSSVGSPGAAAKAITVGASDKTDKLAYFSSRGPVTGYIIKPDLLAPGVDINSSVRGGGYAKFNGTSMAAPHVTGAVALLRQLYPTWTPEQLKAAVANSALDLGLNPFEQGSGRLQLAEAAVSSYLAVPNSLSMGLVDNDVSVWSNTQTFTVYNDLNTAQTIDLSISSGLPAGLTAELSESYVTLDAGESHDVNLTVTVDNSVLPYPSAEPYSYSGKVVLDNSVEERQVPFALIKAAQLILNWDVTPTFVRIHNSKHNQRTIVQPTSPYYAVLPPDTYDIISWWSSGNYTVVNEGIILTGSTTKNISQSEASHAANFQLRDHTEGVQPVTGSARNVAIWQPSTGQGLVMISLSSGGIPFSGHVSDMSDAYHYDVTGKHRHENTDTYYAPVFTTQGVSTDLDMTSDYTEAKQVDFTYNVFGNELRRIYYIWARWFAASIIPPPIPNLTTERWYLSPIPSEFFFDKHSIQLMHSTDYGYYAYGNYFIPASQTSYAMQVRNYDPVTNSYSTEQIEYSDSSWQVNGSPHYWASNTKNTASAVVITPNTGNWSQSGKYFFVRSQWQDQYNIDVNDVIYELLDSGGSPVQSGTLGSSYTETINTSQGAYTLNTSYPGLLRGNPTVGTMMATFDTSLSDKNPPVIQELQIRQDGERTDTVADGEGQVAVRAADADTFTVAIAVDWGDGWQDLSVNASGDFQVANLPAFYPSEDKGVSLRITATDASGNKMVNTIAPAFIVQEATAPAGWTLEVNSSGADGVTITGNPSEYGGITSYSKTEILDGSIITLTAPAAGSESATFSSWSGCDKTDASARTCTVTMSADKTVTASFSINIYMVTPSAGNGGSISPDTPQSVEHGQTTGFTITPDTGYSIDTVEGCGGTLSGNTYTTGAISADCAVTATFVSNTIYTVIPKARRHGSIAPDTPQQVSEGKSTSFTVTPDDGYTIKSVSGCEGTLDDNIYTTGPITGKCRVRASFKKNPVVISSAGRHGSIEPSGRLSVSEGTVLHFTVTPDAGYFVKSVSGCGGKLNGNVYTADSISRKCKVKASFKRKR